MNNKAGATVMEMRYREKGLSVFVAKQYHAENARNLGNNFKRISVKGGFSSAQKFNVKHMKRVIKGVTGKQ